MSLGAKRRRRAERVYHAPELAAGVREDLRGRADDARADDARAEAIAGLRAERARLIEQLAAVEAALREMGDG